MFTVVRALGPVHLRLHAQQGTLLPVEGKPSRQRLKSTVLTSSVLTSSILAAFVSALVAAPALAQQAPNAGQLLRQQPAPPPAAAPPPSLALPAPPAPAAEAGPRVLVKGVRVTGSKLIPADELAAQLTPLVGKEHSFADLQRAAATLIAYYFQKGYLARVFLPPQAITDGVVEYRVVEGARGALKIDSKGRRLDADRVRRFIEARLAQGAPMDLKDLADAINVLNEQPGAQVTAVVGPGKGEREVDVNVQAHDAPLLSYTAGINNEGSLGTGALQGTGTVTVANPTGRFDAISLLVNGSQGAVYARGGYSLAVGDRGLRLGLDVSGLDYRLIQPSLAALHGAGWAGTAGVEGSYPIIDRNALALSVTGGFDGEQFVDSTAAGETSNRTLEVGRLGLVGHRFQTSGPFTGVQTFGLALMGGNSSQINPLAAAADQLGAHSTGGFAKLMWNLGLIRPLPGGWTFSGQARGQFADANLDPSQEFALGGPSGVRGYPQAEATGDEGWIANIDITRPIAPAWTIGGFFDGGGITVHHTPWFTGAVPKGYTLAATGATLGWRVAPRAVISAVVATPVGPNPGAQPDGTNSDGSRRTVRFWLSLNTAF